MREFIDEHSEQSCSLEQLSALVGRRASYLSRLFREQMGCGVHAYVIRTRMRRAAQLLRQGDKVEAVALQVGYRSKKHFYRHFKSHYGATPGTFRVEHQPRTD